MANEAILRVEVVDQARTRALRREVLRPNLPSHETLPGDELDDAIHLAALLDDTVVGTCFVYRDPCPWQPDRPDCWHLRQMATAERQRGRGVGAAVLRAAIDTVHEQGGRLLWCNARDSAVGFYARHGFRPQGEGFVEHGIPHLRMWREIGPEGGT